MAKNLLDNVAGLRTFHTFQDGKNYISYEQEDVQPLMDFAHAMREEGDSRIGDFAVSACRLPMTVVMELRIKHHIDVLKKLEPKDERRLWNLLETDYKVFKLTNQKMYLP